MFMPLKMNRGGDSEGGLALSNIFRVPRLERALKQKFKLPTGGKFHGIRRVSLTDGRDSAREIEKVPIGKIFQANEVNF